MTPEQASLLNWLFTTASIDTDPKACPADQMRQNLQHVEEWVPVPHSLRRDGRTVMMTDALDALVAFYLEHREAG